MDFLPVKAKEVKYRDDADSNNEVDEAPDFSCAICRVSRAVHPVILSECGHLNCWTCFEHRFREASLQGAIKCPVPCCSTESSSSICLYVAHHLHLRSYRPLLARRRIGTQL
ncbi:hypothetical protein KP509_19G011900 [Ceratopteris richardii]|uniref:RING-type domain-containing protein n=1 Tax=Ceratopteris richardii TaxID=49495 RepID=A0A8T2SJS7_CERRI|nr:hypothetical protein KP509_19G011900 [Ceratopteris richardii]